jgi:hypothetical protein
MKIALFHNLGDDARPYYAVKGAEPHKKSLYIKSRALSYFWSLRQGMQVAASLVGSLLLESLATK